MAERDVEKARREAKLRTRSGQATSYVRALNQLATESGYRNWAEYSRVLAAMPSQPPDIRVRLVAAGGRERIMGTELEKVLAFHELDEAQWNLFAHPDRLQLVFEFALSMRRERGDMERYTPELLESNVPTLTVPEKQSVENAAGVAGADFMVALESSASRKKELIGVHLADLLEFHGLSQADWEASSPEEKEALVEETALWTKRSTGDLGSYFTQVVSGLDEGEGEGSAPR